MNKIDYSIYLIADYELLGSSNPVDKILSAVQGGVSLVQLRAKNIPDRQFYELACLLKKELKKYKTPLIIDDRADIALAADADGVHVGQKDLPLGKVRQIIGRDKIIGATANTLDQALEAEKEGADYIGIGPVFPTTTKQNPAPVVGTEKLKIICSHIKIPIVAIGGINSSNLPRLKNTGVKGIAVASAILKAENCAKAAEKIKIIWLE
ncbi:thiamine phosphate synthase [Thermosyntropha sp.]|uniref:thiamine phosphate synthase n=1 Tax=Thermosyntropha sp. TaxID=2740820 RepID=UPI0025EA0EFC|nr:thiamine phosphate synthase [Thermosyntropha sp.]MBO8158294.1 thiamine phosphate synthase [Thermosyntropha sp.]